MATIIIRNSTGSGIIPSSLQQGELAINTKDGKLFYGSGSGNIVKEFTGSGGGTPGGSNTHVQFNQLGSFGGSSAFTYNSASLTVNIGGDLVVTNKIDTPNRYLIDNAAINSVGWQTRYLYDTTAALSIDWESRQLYDNLGNTSVDYQSRYLYSEIGNNAFVFDNEIFTYSDFYHASLKTKTLAQEGFSSDSSSYAGDIIEGTLHSAVNVSDLVYLESADGKWYQADQTSTSSTKMLGICVLKDKTGYILLEGHVTINDSDNGIGPYVEGVGYGLPIYMNSGSIAKMSAIPPTTDYIRLLGHAYYNSGKDAEVWIMKFKPDNTWTKI